MNIFSTAKEVIHVMVAIVKILYRLFSFDDLHF